MKKFSILSLFAISALMMSFTTKQSKADIIETTIVTVSGDQVLVQEWDDGVDCTIVYTDGVPTWDDC